MGVQLGFRVVILVTFVLCAFALTAEAQNCPSKWFKYAPGNTCVYVSEKGDTYLKAKDACKSLNAKLVKITDSKMNAFIQSQIKGNKTDAFIGLNDLKTENKFMWNDEKTVGKYFNWQKGSPNKFGRFRDCVYIRYRDGLWTDSFCRRYKKFICQKDTSPPSITPTVKCSTGWTAYEAGNTCIKFATKGLTKQKGRASCKAQGGDLLKIPDKATNDFITKTIKDNKLTGHTYYIGLHDTDKEKHFRWNDDIATTTFLNWKYGEPNNWGKGEDCVVIQPDQRWYDRDCNIPFRYICQKPPITPAVKCSTGWTAYEAGNTCIKFATKGLTKQKGRASCKAQGGDLLKIPDKATNDFITKTIKDNKLTGHTYYIGLHDTDKEKHFRWNDEIAATTFLNWKYGEPNNWGNGEDCAVIQPDQKWYDKDCNIPFRYICQKPPVNCDSDWSEYPNSPYCYKLFPNDKTDYKNATKRCEDVGAKLTSILSPEEQSFLTNMAVSYSISSFLWIGANDKWREGGVRWVDYKPLAFVNWDDDQPNNRYNQDCVAMRGSTGKWDDLRCNSKYGYICKKKGKRPIPTIAPTTTPKTTPANRKYGCPPGKNPYKNYCYSAFHYATDGVTWSDARILCQSKGADLVSIADGAENRFVSSIIPRQYKYQMWIGMSDTARESTFIWSDNSPVTYTNWDRKQPGSVGNADCVMMNTINGRWAVHHCTLGLKKLVMCKQKKTLLSAISTSLQDGCSQGSLGYGGYCYAFPSGIVSFSAAETACKKMKGHLATVSDNHVQSFLAPEMAKYVGYARWIGLSSAKASGGAYSWTSGASLGSYTNWARGHTGKENNTCVAMQRYKPVGLWWDFNCSEASLPYICELPRKGYTTPTTVTTTIAQITCPTGWYTLDNMCYMPVANTKSITTWREARDNCTGLADRGNLVTISSKKISDFLLKKIKSDNLDITTNYWIGLSDLSTENGFKWADGAPYYFNKWGPNEPNDHADSEDCAEWDLNKGTWNDMNCLIARNYICQMPRGSSLLTPAPTVDVGPTDHVMCGKSGDWHYHDKNCYWLVYNVRNLTWPDAVTSCRRAASELVSIGNEAENNFVFSLASKFKQKDLWIGLSDMDSGIYRWTDRSPLSYQSWGPDEPNDFGGSERCTEMNLNTGKWNDRHCSDTLSYVCKFHPGIVKPGQVTTPIPTGGCPPGYTTHPKASHCFKVFGQGGGTASFDNAAKYCNVLIGGSLATIKNQLEQDLVLTLMMNIKPGRAWIGLSSKRDKNQYEWFDNNPTSYVNWRAGYPRPYKSRKYDCVTLLGAFKGSGEWINMPCGVRNPYVCQVPKSSKAPPQTADSTGCNRGYQRYGNSCYKFVTKSLKFDEAENMCASQQGHLASITNRYEAAFFNLLTAGTDSNVWTGLKYDLIVDLFLWSDGWPVVYTQWGPDQPEQSTCVSANSTTMWESTDCQQKLPFVCEVNLGTAPPFKKHTVYGICPDNWVQSGDHCYYVNKIDKETRPFAASNCKKEGGTLASILNRDENALVAKFVGGTDQVWIGLHRGLTSGYHWDDGAAVNYHVFKAGTAVNGPCITFQNQKWQKTGCFEKHGYICKKMQKGLTTTMTTTTTTTTTTTSSNPSDKPVTLPDKTNNPAGSTKAPGVSTKKQTGNGDGSTIAPGGSTEKQTGNGDGDKNLSPGGTAGIVIGVVIVVILVAFVVVFVRKRGIGFGGFLNRTETPAAGFDNVMYSNSGDRTVSLS